MSVEVISASQNPPKLFNDNRVYDPTDIEIINLLGSKEKQAQDRHHKRSPNYFRLGRRIKYHGIELNSWAESQHVCIQDSGIVPFQKNESRSKGA